MSAVPGLNARWGGWMERNLVPRAFWILNLFRSRQTMKNLVPRDINRLHTHDARGTMFRPVRLRKRQFSEEERPHVG